MAGKAPGLLMAATLLAACSTGAPAGGGPAAGLCDFTVTEAEAWINRMPTVGEQRTPQLIVSVKVTPADRIRALTALSQESRVLRLGVAEGAAPLMAGVLSWRMYAPETPYESIEISCNGAVKTRITTIQSVY